MLYCAVSRPGLPLFAPMPHVADQSQAANTFRQDGNRETGFSLPFSHNWRSPTFRPPGRFPNRRHCVESARSDFLRRA